MTATSEINVPPTVSVVIATYNMGVHIRAAIESVLAQTFSDLEVIIVDDGSTDDTQGQLTDFTSDPRVVLVHQENQGQPKAKNAGLRRARGRFIAFCDADDYWLDRKLELQLPLFDTDPRLGVVYSPATALHPDGSQSTLEGPQYLRGDVLHHMFVRNIVPFGTAVVRRECVEAVGEFDESIPMGIDWDWWLRIATCWSFDFVPESTYVYRIWDGQMSKNWKGRYHCALAIMEKFLQTYPGRIPDEIVATAYADTYTNLSIHHLHHYGLLACASTLRRAFSHKLIFWPAWKLALGMPFYWLRVRLFR